MIPDDAPLAGFGDLQSEMQRVARGLEHVKARLILVAADPEGELTSVSQMLRTKRGCRR